MYPILLFIAVMFVFSLRSVVMKLLTKKISVETILMIVIGINLLLMMLCYFFLFDKKRIRSDFNLLLKDSDSFILWSVLLIAGMVSVVFRFVYYNMIKEHNLYHVSLLLATLPIFVLVTSYITLGEEITSRHLLAMAIIISGALLLESKGGILTQNTR
jgi:drug/metabolite transporter (DMT)-like permease